MDDRTYEQQPYPQKQEMYSVHSVQSSSQSQSSKKYGGEYGYNNYYQEDNYKQPKAQYYQQDSLDQKLQEEQKRNSIANNIPRPQNSNIKPSIKIHEQKSNMILGDNNYNYWYTYDYKGMTTQMKGEAAISPAKDHHSTNSPSLNSHNKTIQKRLQ